MSLVKLGLKIVALGISITLVAFILLLMIALII